MSEKSQPPKTKSTTSPYLFDKPRTTRDDFLTEIVGQFIARRKELGLAQEEVDLRMGNADRQCSKWECGQRTPTSFNLLCWAEALEAKLDLLVD